MDITTQPRNIGKTERQKTLLATLRSQKSQPVTEDAATVPEVPQPQPPMPLEAFLQHNGWNKPNRHRRRKPQKGRNKKQARKITRMHR